MAQSRTESEIARERFAGEEPESHQKCRFGGSAEILEDGGRIIRVAEQLLAHVGKTLDCLREVLYSRIGIAVFDAVTHAMLNMPFKHHLTAFMQR